MIETYNVINGLLYIIYTYKIKVITYYVTKCEINKLTNLSLYNGIVV